MLAAIGHITLVVVTSLTLSTVVTLFDDDTIFVVVAVLVGISISVLYSHYRKS